MTTYIVGNFESLWVGFHQVFDHLCLFTEYSQV